MAGFSKIVIALSLIWCSAVLVTGQTPQPTPQPAPQPAPVPAPTRTIYVPAPGFRRGSDASGKPPDISDMIAARQAVLSDYAREIYGKPTSEELKAVEPSASLRERYAVFLRGRETGIFKFAPSSECSKNKFLVSASAECRVYTMPGAGASYSFRKENYQVRQLADLTFDGGKFVAGGVLSNSVIVDLGDVAIETIFADAEAVKLLARLVPASQVEDARRFENASPEPSGTGLSYTRSADVTANHTYILRVIAYRGRVERAVRGVEYNELDYDKRGDIIIAFRVIDVDENRGVTVIWKKIADLPAERLKGEREEFRAWVREFDVSISPK